MLAIIYALAALLSLLSVRATPLSAIGQHAQVLLATPTNLWNSGLGSVRATENSGVCETTPSVYQASGYVNITETEALFFWYFDARNHSETAPLALWFNGGPGASSLLGLFQELGPCLIANDSASVTLNPYAWNNNANMLFIDSPVGVGFSYGDMKVGSAQGAAEDIWRFMQVFLMDERFAALQGRETAIWTESYGGHYGPAFADHFLLQNDAVEAGDIDGLLINLTTLGVGNGLTDPLLQYPGYISYAKSNPYHQLVSDEVIQKANNSWLEVGGCRDQITTCYDTEVTTVCADAKTFCNENILEPLSGEYDRYYVLDLSPSPFPASLEPYLTSVGLQASIGAETNWSTHNSVRENFEASGDWMVNSRPALEDVIERGVKVVVYDGDADYIVNYQGVEAMVDALPLNLSELDKYTVDGQVVGLYKDSEDKNFAYVRFYGAGHMVPSYGYEDLKAGTAALRMFEQAMGLAGWDGTVRPS